MGDILDIKEFFNNPPKDTAMLVMSKATLHMYIDICKKRDFKVKEQKFDEKTLADNPTAIPMYESHNCPIGFVVAADKDRNKLAVYKL